MTGSSPSNEGVCQHGPCSCKAREGQAFCSDFCEKAASDPALRDAPCRCGEPCCG